MSGDRIMGTQRDRLKVYNWRTGEFLLDERFSVDSVDGFFDTDGNPCLIERDNRLGPTEKTRPIVCTDALTGHIARQIVVLAGYEMLQFEGPQRRAWVLSGSSEVLVLN
ncbi:MAG: hypothetical protein Q4D79_10655 [Propionibacteriaceae bacterium]|nr:hypothetical protein [Propionibacteriaceae bacterium]